MEGPQAVHGSHSPRRQSDAHAEELSRQFAEALLAGDGRAAEGVARLALDRGLSAPAVLGRVVAPGMRRIGELWEQGTASVADEHLATALAHRVLASLYAFLLVARPASRERVLLAAVEGQHHVLGLRMAADVLEGAGFDVLYLGGDVPVAALARAVADRGVTVVGLSHTMADGTSVLEDALDELAARAPSAIVFLGGPGVPDSLRDSMPYVANVERVVPVVEQLLEMAPPGPATDESDLPAASVASGDGEPERSATDRLAAVAADVGDVARRQARLAYEYREMALTDPVSGLPNRRAFDDRLAEAVAGGSAVELLVVDLDDFKSINDEHGHDVGDEVLRTVADTLRRCLRAGDFAARLGGDEFALVLPAAGREDAPALGERVRSAIEGAQAPVALTASVGITTLDGDARQAMLVADRALYAAKRRGRNAVVRAVSSAADAA
jgi:diguanylate cyclase (GGDEF)-like protein